MLDQRRTFIYFLFFFIFYLFIIFQTAEQLLRNHAHHWHKSTVFLINKTADLEICVLCVLSVNIGNILLQAASR